MTNIERDDKARRRDELSRDSTGRRLTRAIDARRRLNAPRAVATLSASRVAQGDPRYAYLAEPHD
jgi:hypothetical protein